MATELTTEKQTKKPNTTAQIFNLIGMIGVTVLSVLGLLYVLHGNKILTTLFGIIILASLAFLTKFLVDNKIKVRTYQNLKPEIFLSIIYLIVVIVSFPFMFHYLDIDFSRKSELKILGKEKVETISDLKKEYKEAIDKKQRTFRAAVEDNLSSYFRTQKSQYKDSIDKYIGSINAFSEFEDAPDDEEIKTKISDQVEKAIQDGYVRIETEYDLGQIGEKSEDFVIDSKRVFSDWKLLKVSHTYYEVDGMYQKVYDEMRRKMPGFESKLPEMKNMEIDNALYSLSEASIGKWAIVLLIVIILHVAVLAEYIAAKRHENVLVYNPKGKTNSAGDGWNVD